MVIVVAHNSSTRIIIYLDVAVVGGWEEGEENPSKLGGIGST